MARHLTHRLSEVSKAPDAFAMNIVVRDWNEIEPELEFRAFVHKGKFTALTHYYKALYVEGTRFHFNCTSYIA